MSIKNFYQAFYQADQLFRLENDVWAGATGVTEELAPRMDEAEQTETPDLFKELDALSNGLVTNERDNTPLVDTPAPPLATPVVPEPRVIIPTPEPLPQPVPRATTPSILPPVQQQPRFPQLNHKVLLLADEALDPSNLLFLEKILKAVNLNVDGVDLLNLHGAHDLNFAELLRGKYINHFITFGVPFERINLDIMMDRYSPVRFEGITFLMADSLPTIEADQNLKKRLWAALQRVFLRR
ncbi:hypothetical protein [Spirosoma fluminis]